MPGRIHTFCHAVPERWYQLGATLSAGLSLRWLRDRLRLQAEDPYAHLDRLARDVPAGADGLIFLPYLVGERSPIMDPGGHRRLRRPDPPPSPRPPRARRAGGRGLLAAGDAGRRRSTPAGTARRGWRPATAWPARCGAASWPTSSASPCAYVDAPERSGVGAALLGGIGAGVYGSFAEASEAARPPLRTTDPDPERSARYEAVYQRYLRLSALLLEEGRTSRQQGAQGTGV